MESGAGRRVLLCSINSIDERTGGGHYLRCLVSCYRRAGFEVTLFDKRINQPSRYQGPRISNYKSRLADFVSRVFFSPTFMFFYSIRLMRFASTHEVVAFHSSRLGVVLALVKLICPSKVLVLHFDNVEFDLIRQTPIRPSMKGALVAVDRFLIPIAEYVGCRIASKVTFITNEDASRIGSIYRLEKKEFLVFPISFSPYKSLPSERSSGKQSMLFTGSFDFEPNVEALEKLIGVARKNVTIDFVVAGRHADVAVNGRELPDNMSVFSDLSDDEMRDQFLLASAYISLVTTGSGMKTKIAESLRYGVPVFALRGGVAGYERAIDEGVVRVLEPSELEHLASLPIARRESAVAVFNKYYSHEATSSNLRRYLV